MTMFGSEETKQFAIGGQSFYQAIHRRVAEVLAEVSTLDPRAPDTFPEALPVEAAVAWGDCLLFTGEVPAGTFPEWLAESAANRLNVLLAEASENASQLPVDWDMSGPDEADDQVIALLEARMNAWAAFETLDLVPSTAALAQPLATCEATLARFDEALADRIDYLATVADTELLTNWRLSLADAFRDPLPWWLDGRLESAAIIVEHSIARMERYLIERWPKLPLVSGTHQETGKLRSRFEQRYAAAAQTSKTDAELASVVRWRSPDRLLEARLLPPVGGRVIDPKKVVIEFSTAPSGNLAALRGCVAVFGEVGVPLGWRVIDDEEIVIAEFPFSVLQSGGGDKDGAPPLVVFPEGDVWEQVPISGRA